MELYLKQMSIKANEVRKIEKAFQNCVYAQQIHIDPATYMLDCICKNMVGLILLGNKIIRFYLMASL
jgi:hypothetical protein